KVIFTSGGTEANNLALLGCGAKTVLVSAVEHPSVLMVRDNCRIIKVDENGQLRLEHLEELLRKAAKPVLVSVMLANNETGVIQPVEEVVKLARKYGAWMHCDAVQGFGRIEVDMEGLGVDMLTISAHKFGGPK